MVIVVRKIFYILLLCLATVGLVGCSADGEVAGSVGADFSKSEIIVNGKGVADGNTDFVVIVRLVNSRGEPISDFRPETTLIPVTGASVQSCTLSDAFGVSVCLVRSTAVGIKSFAVTNIEVDLAESIEFEQATFTITGATGAGDVAVDEYLAHTEVTANWEALAGTSSYDVVIRNNADSADVCSVQNTASLNYTFSGCTLVDDTLYKIKVTAKDSDGNLTEAANHPFTFSVDTTGPVASIDTQPSDPSNNDSPSFTFSANDAGVNPSGVASFECQLDSGGYSACTSAHSLSALADGSHTFDVRAVDNVGNISVSASYTWDVDTTNPVASIDSQPSDPSNDTSSSFTFSGTDGGTNPSGVASYECQLDSGGYGACTSAHSLSGLSDGSHTFYVRAIDNAGNVSTIVDYTWTTDTVSPAETKVTASDAASGDFFGNSVSISGTNVIVGSYQDDSNGSAYIYQLDPSSNTWAESKITASDPYVGDLYGYSVSISGSMAIVGAYNNDDAGSNSGSAYIYRLDPSSNTWVETKITASDAAAGDSFGYSVSIAGTTAIIGAMRDDDNGSDSGSAYIYQLIPGTNTWDETKITAGDSAASDHYGNSVSISGTTAIVGARENDDYGIQSGSAYIYRFDPSSNTWAETKITPSDGGSFHFYGNSVSISETTAIVGAYQDDDNGAQSGSAYIYRFDPSSNTWAETKITASDGATNDDFGFDVSISGTTAIVGAREDDDNGSNSGSAYVYRFDPSSNTWAETKVIASDGAADDKFGERVAISGTKAIVSAWWDDDAGAQSGSVYIYEFPPFFNETKITTSDAAADDWAGYSVSISDNTAIVSSHRDDDNGSFSGSVYIYQLDPSTNTWAETKVIASDGLSSDSFGYSVSISGTTAIVAAYGDDDNGLSSGSAYIYRLDPSSNTWDETKILASDGAAYDSFGSSVSISGTTAIVGAWGDDDNGSSSGSAYIYQLDPSTDTWEETKITASNGSMQDFFGTSVSVSGTTAIVGAYGDDFGGSSAGSAYIYQLNPSTNIWDETQINASDRAANDWFGYSVSISGTTAIVGSYQDDDNGGQSGSAYIYRLDPSSNTWAESKITASDGAVGFHFGFAVSISGTTAIVGSRGDSHGGASSGSAYIYQFDPSSNNWMETKLTASDAAANDLFGYSVSISGNTAIVGAYQDDDDGSSSGSAYLLRAP